MKRTAYHVTRHLKKVLHSGIIKPARLHCVYLLKSRKDVSRYAHLFGGNGAVKVEYNTSDVESRWRAVYAPGGCVRLEPGKTARVLREMRITPKVKVKTPKCFDLGGEKIIFKPVCVPVGYDGRKGGGRSPRRSQLTIRLSARKKPTWYMALYEVKGLQKYLRQIEQWMIQRGEHWD